MSYCEAGSKFRKIPIYHLEAAIINSVPSMDSGGKLSPAEDPETVARKLVENPEMDEFCWSLYFDPSFLIRLFHAGFLPIACNIGAPGDPIYVLLPKLHFRRSIVRLTETVGKRARKKSAQYILSVNEDFAAVVQGCLAQHGDRCWLYPPLRSGLMELNQRATPYVHSVELRRVDSNELVAGEIGYTVGGMYTSMTGFYRESGAGAVQLFLLREFLQQKGFEIWDLGMEMEYKTKMLGAVLVNRKEFVEILKKIRAKRVELTYVVMLSIVLDMDVCWWTSARLGMVADSIRFFVGTIGLAGSLKSLNVIACFHDKAVTVIDNWRNIGGLLDKLEELTRLHAPIEDEVYEIPIAQGISKAVCYAHRFLSNGNTETNTNVIVFECSCGDGFVGQTVALSNTGWAANLQGTCVHVVSLGAVGKAPSAALMSLCNKTGGVYIPPQFTQSVGELVQALLFHLAHVCSNNGVLLQTHRRPPDTHMAATCVCHNKQCTMGYVCSICLAVYCSETAGTCAMCGSRIRREAKEEQPISAQTFSKLFRT